MSITDLIPVQYRLLTIGLVMVALMALAAGGAAQFQAYRYGEQLQLQGRGFEGQLAQRDKLHADTMAEIQRAAMAQQRREQEKRVQLEGELRADSATNHRKLTDAQTVAARLRDRLATADLRLSVLLDASSSTQHCGSGSAASTGGMVHGGVRADIDPGAAQRIVAITDRGDRAIIALGACQAYALKVSTKQ